MNEREQKLLDLYKEYCDVWLATYREDRNPREYERIFGLYGIREKALEYILEASSEYNDIIRDGGIGPGISGPEHKELISEVYGYGYAIKRLADAHFKRYEYNYADIPAAPNINHAYIEKLGEDHYCIGQITWKIKRDSDTAIELTAYEKFLHRETLPTNPPAVNIVKERLRCFAEECSKLTDWSVYEKQPSSIERAIIARAVALRNIIVFGKQSIDLSPDDGRP